MKREKNTGFKNAVLVTLVMGLAAFAAETDDPNNNLQRATPGQLAGDVLGTFVPGLGGTTPVGLEAYNGGLWGTDISNDAVGFMNLSGTLQNGFTGLGTPIGVTTDGSLVYVGDTTTAEIHAHNTSGTLQSTFSVAGATTFPEGLTINPNNGHIYVVDGSGGNQVAEYTTAGTLVNTFPILGSSPDGIAYDGAGGYYIYDSGTDTLRLYDGSFNQVDSFGGTISAGFAGGEGVAFADNVVYIVATGSNLVVAFDAGRVSVPTLSEMGLIAMVGFMLLGSIFVIRRRGAVA